MTKKEIRARIAVLRAEIKQLQAFKFPVGRPAIEITDEYLKQRIIKQREYEMKHKNKKGNDGHTGGIKEST
jgi:hypothetical protein